MLRGLQKAVCVSLCVICFLWAAQVKALKPAGCTDVVYNSRSYMYCQNTLSRDEAQASCNMFNLSLTVINSSIEFDHWLNYVKDIKSNNKVWVGATFSVDQTAFVWDTGSRVQTSFFEIDPPNVIGIQDGTCVVLDQGYLKEADCITSSEYLCQDRSRSQTDVEEGFTVVPDDCWCSCDREPLPATEEEINKYIDQIIAGINEDLSLDKEKLSSTKRKKYSAEDDRISAKSMGYIGVVTLIWITIVIIWMDAAYIRKSCDSLKAKFKSKAS